jgi:uncharacterized OB-fold protein
MTIPIDSILSTPPLSSPGDTFQKFIKAGEFRLQFCNTCRKPFFYPRTLCPQCGGGDLEWCRVSGEGTVYSTTPVRQKPERGGDYNVSIIELAEGPRMMSAVRSVAPDQVAIGLQVTAMLIEEEGVHKVYFRPSGAIAGAAT